MNNKVKSFMSIFLSAVMIFSLSSCGNINSTSKKTIIPDPSQTPVDTFKPNSNSLKINIFQSNYSIAKELKAAAIVYEKENPNIEINVTTVKNGSEYRGELKPKLTKSLTIFNVFGQQDLKDLNGQLEDLSTESWISNAKDGTLAQVTLDKKVYGLPTSIAGYGFVYNKEIFKAAGIDPKTLNSFQSEMLAFSKLKKLINSGSLRSQFPQLSSVFSLPAKETDFLGLYTLNVALNHEFDGEKAAFDAKELSFTYKDSLKKLIDMETNFSAPLDNKGILNKTDYANQIDGGIAIDHVAVIQQGSWIYPEVASVNKNIADNLGMLPIPLEGKSENTISVGVPSYWCINKNANADAKTAGKAFLNWLYTSKEGKDIIINNFHFIPPFTNFDGLMPTDSLSKDVQTFIKNKNTSQFVFGGFPSYSGISVFGSEMQNYFNGTKTFDEVCSDTQVAWKKERTPLKK